MIRSKKTTKTATPSGRMTKSEYESWFTHLEKKNEYAELRVEKIALAVFLSLPKKQRGTLGEFSAMWGVSRQTLSAWQQEEEVLRLRTVFMRSVIAEHTPDVLDNLLRAALSTDPKANPIPAIRLWFEYVEGWKGGAEKRESEMPVVHFGFPEGSQFIKPIEAPKKKSVREALGVRVSF